MTYKEFTKDKVETAENPLHGFAAKDATLEETNNLSHGADGEISDIADTTTFNDYNTCDYNLEGESLW